MDLKVTVRKAADFTPEMEDYLQRKVAHLEHYSNQETFRVEAIIVQDRFQKICELMLHLKKKELFARASDVDFKLAIDEASQKLKAQMEKYFKKKIEEKRRRQ